MAKLSCSISPNGFFTNPVGRTLITSNLHCIDSESISNCEQSIGRFWINLNQSTGDSESTGVRSARLDRGKLRRQWWRWWRSNPAWKSIDKLNKSKTWQKKRANMQQKTYSRFSPDSPGYGLNLTKGTSFWLKHLAGADLIILRKKTNLVIVMFIFLLFLFHLSKCVQN